MGSARGHLATATICIALGIASVMIIINSITEYLRPVAPESNVDRIMCMNRATEKEKGSSGIMFDAISLEFAQDYLATIKATEYVSIYTRNTFPRVNGAKTKTFVALACDANYWRIFDFRFTEGRSFTTNEFNGKANVAVVSESFFQQLNEQEKQQMRFSYKSKEYRIVGVCKDVSTYRSLTSAHVWIPYSTQFEPQRASERVTGRFEVAFLLKSSKDVDKLKAEVAEVERRYNSTKSNRLTIQLVKPQSKLDSLILGWGISEEGVRSSFFLRWISIIAVILLVPILNLTILNYSHIKDHYTEMGVRKAFGATESSISIFFMKENLTIVLLGSIVGYSLSFGFALIHHVNLFDKERYTDVPLDNMVYPNLLSFAVVLGFCLLISTLPGMFPAWRLAKMNIATALKGGQE